MKRSILTCRNGIWGGDALGDSNDILCIRVADFDRQRLRVALNNPTIRNVTEKERDGRLLSQGHLLLEKSGGGEGQPVGCVVLYDDASPAVCSNFVARVQLAENMNAPYWRYLHAAAYSARLNLRSIKQTSGIQNLDQQQYLDERAGFPPAAEQASIAAFLDRETAKIDELVCGQRRLMELLKEKRLSVISHAVTKGLNPDASLKPSGVDGLGNIPAHWEVRKMKWAAMMESGHTPDKKIPEYWEGGTIPWVSLNDTGYLRDHDYISETAYQVSEAGIANSSARILPSRAVIFSRDATIGRCAITTRPMAVSQHFIAWICGPTIIPEYLLLRLRSMTQELDRLATGATLKTIGMPDVRTIVTPIPPVAEQIAILEWVSTEVNMLDLLMGEVQRAVDLLRERRSALISAAVTGQIDVRGLAASEAA